MGYLVLLIYALVFLLASYKAAPVYSRWLNRHPFFVSIFALLGGLVFGFVGRDMGLPTLFWHEDRAIQFGAGVEVAGLLMLLGLYTFILEDDRPTLMMLVDWQLSSPLLQARWPQPPAPGLVLPSATQLRRFLNALAVPVLVALAGVPVLEFFSKGGEEGYAIDYCMMPLGALVLIGFANGTLLLTRWKGLRRPPNPAFAALLVLGSAALAIVLTQVDAVRQSVSAALSICLLLALVATLGFLTYGRPLLKVAVTLGLLGWMAVTNGLDPFKFSTSRMKDFGDLGRN